MRFDVDRTLKILLTIILAAVVGYFGWQVVQRVLYPLTLFVMGAIVAFILSPLVKRLHQAGVPKPLAILMVYIGLLAVLSLLGYLLISPLVEQINNVAKNLPNGVKDIQPSATSLDQFNKWLTQQGLPNVDTLKARLVAYLSDWGSIVVQNLSSVVIGSFNFLVNLVLTLVIAFYLLLDGEKLKDRLYQLVPDSQLSRVAFVEATVNEVLGGYLRGQVLMSITIGTMAGVGTYFLHLQQYAVLIGVLAGILELVPMLGPWLASMPALAFALVLSPPPSLLVLWVALYFLIIQQLESNVIGPRITGHAVGVHPLGALMALLVGIELDGILGALFAVPVAGILFVIATAVYYNLSGRPQPVPVRKPARPPWLGGLVRKLGITGLQIPGSGSAQEDTGLARLTTARLRRLAMGNVPERLANVEQARDALLRPILHQRQKAQEEAEARSAVSRESAEHAKIVQEPGAESRTQRLDRDEPDRERELSARAR
jgi:predicted PurR-regulated permease PerM